MGSVKNQPYRAHLGQLVNGLEAVVDALREEIGKELIVEDLQGTGRRDFDDGAQMEAALVVAVPGLDEDRRVRIALGKEGPTDVVELDALADVAPGVLDGRVPVDVRQLAKAEAGGAVPRVGETVDDDRGRVAVEDLADSGVELVVGDGSPVTALLVRYRSHVRMVVHVHGHHGVGRGRVPVLGAVLGGRVRRGRSLGQAGVGPSEGIVVVAAGGIYGAGDGGAVGGNGRAVAGLHGAGSHAAVVEVVRVVGHVLGHRGLAVLGEAHARPSRGKFGVPGHEHGWQDRALDPLVVVRVYADLFLLSREGKLARLQGLELVVRLEVGPAPDPAVDHVGQPLAVRDLEPAVQAPGDGYALARGARVAHSPLELLERALLLLELLHERLDGLLGPLLVFVALFPTWGGNKTR